MSSLALIFVCLLTLSLGHEHEQEHEGGGSKKALIVVPGYYASQLIYYTQVADTLREGGFDVTQLIIATSTVARNFKAPPGMKAVIIEADPEDRYPEFKKQEVTRTFEKSHISMSTARKLMDLLSYFTESALQHADVFEKLKEVKFDIGYAHSYDYGATGILRACGVNTTALLVSGNLIDHMYYYMGVPVPWSYVPGALEPYSDDMTFWQRQKNYMGQMAYLYYYTWRCLPRENKAFQNVYGSEFPRLEQLVANHSLVFVNGEEMIDLPRPIMHKVIYIAGAATPEPKPVSEEWEHRLKKGKNGAVLFSVTSAANSKNMPEDLKKAIFKAFKWFPDYQFVVRFEGEVPESAGSASNIDVVKRIPQYDLLNNKHVKLFITNGGQSNLLEAATAGVPVIMIPLFDDQVGNAIRAERAGLGISMDFQDITEKKFLEALGKVLRDVSYHKKADEMAQKIAKKPFPAKERLVEWSNYLAEFKTLDNLRPASADLSTFQSSNIGGVLLASLAGLLVLALIALLVYLVYLGVKKLAPKIKPFFEKIKEKLKNLRIKKTE